MEIHNFEQGTPEWFAIRQCRLTASHATAIGNCGKGLKTYVEDMMAEYYSSGEKDQYEGKDTRRGNELEPFARQIYELQRGVKVEQVGFMSFGEHVGASPDGLVQEDGGLEIKSIDDKSYFRHILYGEKEIDSGHVWQVQMNLLISGRKWWDLAYYNPNFKKSIFVYRIYPDQEKFDALSEGFQIGVDMINKIKSIVG